ncbi:MAG TPA: hypothetical protein VGP22_02955 [Albitalea sp.]|nr:hypothetical protein [Albitalea sp.]
MDQEQLLAAIATDLQRLPAAAERVARVAAAVEANNACVAQASLALLRMEDHPGSFDPWCRGFAQPKGGA